MFCFLFAYSISRPNLSNSVREVNFPSIIRSFLRLFFGFSVRAFVCSFVFRSLVHAFVLSFIFYSSIYSFVRTFAHWLARSFVLPLVHWFARSFLFFSLVHLFFHSSFVCLFVRLLVRACVRSFACSFVRLFVRSCVLSFVRSFVPDNQATTSFPPKR